MDAPSIIIPIRPRYAQALCAVLFAVIAAVDFLSPANIVFAMLFAVPVALAVWSRRAAFVWSLAVAAIAVIFFDHLFGHSPTYPQGLVPSLINRGIASGMVLLAAALAHLRIRAQARVEMQQQQLEQQAYELEATNRELAQREEEIVRQNEELQSQTEELERQSEELRVTNEDLLQWEKMLEQLLELSRSLTVDMTREQVFSRICETLSMLSQCHAAAILERVGDDLVIQCHQSFGADGPAATVLPFTQSFSSLVMSLGQTGFLEDTQLRPDLVIPRPAAGEPFRAVLSAPLRTGGRTVGTIELYNLSPRTWTEADVAMIESLAAQASISLQSQQLVEAIRQERRRFEAAFRTVPFGLAVADDPEGRHVHINPAAAAMLQLPVDENVSAMTPTGMRMRQNVFQDDRRVTEDELPLTQALRGVETHGEVLEFLLPKGRALTLLCSAAPIYDGQGNIVGAVSAFADLTLQSELMRELEIRRREAEEASIRKTRFLAAVSHDIRTPANAISLMAELIRRDAADSQAGPEISSLAERLQANTHALIELVGDVLDVARFDSGKIEVVESEFSLGNLIDDECRQLLPLAHEKRLSIDVVPLARPVWLRTDRVKLARVLGNMIGNAIKFTQEGGVHIGARLDPDPQRSVQIEIADTGMGIPPDKVQSIFDEFAQLHNPARDRMKGSGLGLAICKRLMDVMGGTIQVESRLGAGTRFTVSLPASSIALRLDATTRAAGLSLRSTAAPVTSEAIDLRVLLVEDHETTRDGTARILRDEGISVESVAEGGAALDAMRSTEYDVILLDMMLPDMDGRELLKAVQADRPPNLRGVLVLTGDLTPERLAEIKQLEADGLIEKPVDIRKLVAALRSFTTQSQV